MIRRLALALTAVLVTAACNQTVTSQAHPTQGAATPVGPAEHRRPRPSSATGRA